MTSISYPSDDEIRAAARRHDLPEDVLVRDLVRIVEVLNLKDQDHLSVENVLAGSMALRCRKSPRLTIYDADFSVGNKADQDPGKIQHLLEYTDHDLDIIPEGRAPFSGINNSGWKFEPVRYEPAFTNLAGEDPKFKADFSFRGLVEPGSEVELYVPYDLALWETPPVIWVMDTHEVVAEKTLGWCAHRLVKHYADLGFIAVIHGAGGVELTSANLRETLDAKLDIMRNLHPTRYARFASIDDVIDDLAQAPVFDQAEWLKLIYMRAHRDRFQPDFLIRMVQGQLVPLLRGR